MFDAELETTMSTQSTTTRTGPDSVAAASRSNMSNVSELRGALDFIAANYFTIKQLAQALHVSVRTLLRWNQMHIGPARTSVGGLRLYRKATVENWLKAREEPEVKRKRRA
jgi:excisionase family DNA binding protein